MPRCPVFDVSSLVGKKWTIALMQEVGFNGHRGFNEISRRMGKISPKVLSMRLKELEKKGLIAKRVMNGTGLERTSYRLTGKGRDLQEIIDSFRRWNSEHGGSQDCSERECVKCPLY